MREPTEEDRAVARKAIKIRAAREMLEGVLAEHVDAVVYTVMTGKEGTKTRFGGDIIDPTAFDLSREEFVEALVKMRDRCFLGLDRGNGSDVTPDDVRGILADNR